jgi:arsenate reductase
MNPIRVLFLCTGNSARSIIGAALLRRMGGTAFDVYSAGTQPKGINPFTERVLAAAGISLAGERSKHVSEYDGQPFDYVITVCDDAAEQCPLFPGPARRVHWSFPDPAAVVGTDDQKLAAFQRTLDGMRRRITAFLLEAMARP